MSNDEGDPRELVIFDEQAEARIRKVWHKGQWWYSVVDVVGFLTDSPMPRRYWAELKSKLREESGDQLFAGIVRLTLPATDGRMRYTDCASMEALREIRRYVPAAAAWRRKREAQGVVYAIGLPDGSMVKVGTTINLTNRLRDIQNSSPVPVVLLWQTLGGVAIERRLHTHFAHRRAHGEWFSFAGADVTTELQAAVAEIRGRAA